MPSLAHTKAANPPALVIVKPIEQPAYTYITATHEGDELRVREEIASRPELLNVLELLGLKDLA